MLLLGPSQFCSKEKKGGGMEGIAPTFRGICGSPEFEWKAGSRLCHSPISALKSDSVTSGSKGSKEQILYTHRGHWMQSCYKLVNPVKSSWQLPCVAGRYEQDFTVTLTVMGNEKNSEPEWPLIWLVSPNPVRRPPWCMFMFHSDTPV